METATQQLRTSGIEKNALQVGDKAPTITLKDTDNTDIDKIRKIIKRVGLEMLEDPEIGKDFLRPIRSQGVKQITNSVMTIRVKFTAKPGAQFVIRREAFKRITAAMQAKGIHYPLCPQEGDCRNVCGARNYQHD